ncbi:hypothetical protein V2W45_1340875 [Cenococcum geophilum]
MALVQSQHAELQKPTSSLTTLALSRNDCETLRQLIDQGSHPKLPFSAIISHPCYQSPSHSPQHSSTIIAIKLLIRKQPLRLHLRLLLPLLNPRPLNLPPPQLPQLPPNPALSHPSPHPSSNTSLKNPRSPSGTLLSPSSSPATATTALASTAAHSALSRSTHTASVCTRAANRAPCARSPTSYGIAMRVHVAARAAMRGTWVGRRARRVVWRVCGGFGAGSAGGVC